MIWLLLGAYLVTSMALALLGDRLGRLSFGLGAVPSLAATVWAVAQLSAQEAAVGRIVWLAALDLEFGFSVGRLSALFTVGVAGIGVLVMMYAAGYFTAQAVGIGRFASVLTLFSGAMVGLVWADSIWTLFVFWELTSITSFLLVGHKNTNVSVQAAARRALLITAAGGLALLAGMVLLADAAGTARLSEMSRLGGESGDVGIRANLAAVLILVAAATKSAQVPFHVWLPGAMAAPTPVSAYLHSATMVKAGVVLVAVAAPVLGGVPAWQPVGLTFGIVSMLWGAVGALRHYDGKAILAWGTISQLGLLITLLSIGTAKATFAAVSLMVAHALFKAALFMVVGEIDVRTGTRSINQLNGLWRSMPVTATVGVIAGASMAGVPPLLGFPAKEAAIEATLKLSGIEAAIVAPAVIGGAVLTVAYTVRLLVGLLATKPQAPGSETAATSVAAPRPAMSLPIMVLGAASVVGFVLLGLINKGVVAGAVELDPKADKYLLIRWPGITTAFLVSMAVVAAGMILGLSIARKNGLWGRARPAAAAVLHDPRPRGAEAIDRGVSGVLVGAKVVARRVQHGSLPIYLVRMAITAVIAALPFAVGIDIDGLYWWDHPLQGVLAALIVAAAVGSVVVVDSRLGAALSLGVVGFAVSALFANHGAPDLVLTQLLVETVIVVGFVAGLGHLTAKFPRPETLWRGVRGLVSVLFGGAVAAGLLAAATNRSKVVAGTDLAGTTNAEMPLVPLEKLAEESAKTGGGNNIVNVILTDMRALDTMGEVVVLLVVAIGILALAKAGDDVTKADKEFVSGKDGA